MTTPSQGSGSQSAGPNGNLTPVAPRGGADYQELENRLSSLAASIAHWQKNVESATNRTSRLEGAFTVLVSSLEGWKSDMREVISRAESRVLRGLEVIDSRIVRVQPESTSADRTAALDAIDRLERALADRMKTLESGIARSVDSSGLADRLTRLDESVRAMVPRLANQDGLAERLADAFQRLDSRLQALEQRASSPPALPDQLTNSFQRLEARLQGLEQTVSSPPAIPDQLTQALQRLDSRFQGLEQRASSPPVLPDQLAQALQRLEARLQGLEQTVSSPPAVPDQLTPALQRLEGRLQGLEQTLSIPAAQDPSGFAQTLQGLEARLSAIQDRLPATDELPGRLAEIRATLERRITEGQERVLAAIAVPQEPPRLHEVAAQLNQLQTALTEGQEALRRSLQAVQAGSDENNAGQLRYLGNLEELQAALVKRIGDLEAVVSNPLDAQQWERLAKGFEFLDAKLAQSYDSVANRIDAAIANLTTTLDNRAAANQEANLKSAERLWRALRGLEDQITGSYQMVRQSQERLESATQNLSGALDELRAVTGSRVGHTEKLVMEGLESLDARFSQSLRAVSESLSSALFALNKVTSEWRLDLFNAAEESEERVVSHISQAEAKLSGNLKAGLDALGRREERMLALILGGVPLPSASVAKEETAGPAEAEAESEPKPPAQENG